MRVSRADAVQIGLDEFWLDNGLEKQYCHVGFSWLCSWKYN